VIRGGGWNNKPQNVRSANRNRNNADNRNNNLGFRVASTLSMTGAGAVTAAPGVYVSVQVRHGERRAGGCLGPTWATAAG